MKLKSSDLIQAYEEKGFTVQSLTKEINSYVGMDVKDSHIRRFHSIGEVDDPLLEKYIRFVLDINPPNIHLVKRPPTPQADYKKRMREQSNAQTFIKDNRAKIQDLVNLLGGVDIVAEVCGVKAASPAYWSQLVNDDGVRGYIPYRQRPKLLDYAKRIKVNLTDEQQAFLKPKESIFKKRKKKQAFTSKYTGVTKVNGRWIARLFKGRSNAYLGTYDSELEAAKARANKMGIKVEEMLRG